MILLFYGAEVYSWRVASEEWGVMDAVSRFCVIVIADARLQSSRHPTQFVRISLRSPNGNQMPGKLRAE
jgi:hypothetical protein